MLIANWLDSIHQARSKSRLRRQTQRRRLAQGGGE